MITQRHLTKNEPLNVNNFCTFELKMFLITSPDRFPVTASFKSGDEEFDDLSSREGFQPVPYLARYKWVHVDDIKRVSKKELQILLERSYMLIAKKLPARIRKKLKVS